MRTMRMNMDERQKRKVRKWAVILAAAALCCVLVLVVLPAVTAEPELTLRGEPEISVEYQSAYQDSGAEAFLRNRDISDRMVVTGEVDTSKIGTYEISYTVTSRKKTDTKKRVVHVIDTTAPVITLKGDAEVTVPEIGQYDEPGYHAEDNLDGNVTEQVKSKVRKAEDGTYAVLYTVKDSSGNKASARRKIDIKPDQAAAYGRNPENAVYLTFDDGPSGDVTERILDELKEYGVKATFFICDYDESKIPMLKRMIEEGHTIGIHGYSHDYGKIYQSTDAFMKNVNKLRNKLKKDTGYEAFCMRFPGGSSNVVSAHYSEGIMTKLTKLVEKKGWDYYDWNVDSTDANEVTRPKKLIVKNVTENLSKGRSNVVLMHDLSVKWTTADALPSIIKYGKEHGFSFYPITEDTIPIHHRVNN